MSLFEGLEMGQVQVALVNGWQEAVRIGAVLVLAHPVETLATWQAAVAAVERQRMNDQIWSEWYM